MIEFSKKQPVLIICPRALHLSCSAQNMQLLPPGVFHDQKGENLVTNTQPSMKITSKCFGTAWIWAYI
jgi:hypothetical protein